MPLTDVCRAGTYQIRIAYCCYEVGECEFIAKAWDASRVLLADVGMAEVGIESSFKGWTGFSVIYVVHLFNNVNVYLW